MTGHSVSPERRIETQTLQVSGSLLHLEYILPERGRAKPDTWRTMPKMLFRGSADGGARRAQPAAIALPL